MRTTLIEHCAKVDAIREYIKTLKDIAKVPDQHPDEVSAKTFKEFISMPQKRSYDYSLIIITLYGIFESYVEKMMCAYLNSLEKHVHLYNDLPEIMRKSHIDLSTKLIGVNSAKYGKINPNEIIANLHSCLNQLEGEKYQLNIEAFRQHSANFRIDVLREFFNQAGVENIQNYIAQDPDLTSFIRETMGETESKQQLPVTKYFETLEDLVERRNVVAHGSEVDDLLSLDYLDEYAQYIYVLMNSIYNSVLLEFFSIIIEVGSVENLGTPIDVFDNRIVCINSANRLIKVGHILISKNTKGKIRWGSIESIQINGHDVPEVASDQSVDIGMAVSFSAKTTHTYYFYPNNQP